jgi:hypothetical protein
MANSKRQTMKQMNMNLKLTNKLLLVLGKYREIIILFVFAFVFCSFKALYTEVYICGTAGANKYHYSQNCRGLNACKHEIVKTTKNEAQNLGLTLCGWED